MDYKESKEVKVELKPPLKTNDIHFQICSDLGSFLWNLTHELQSPWQSPIKSYSWTEKVKKLLNNFARNLNNFCTHFDVPKIPLWRHFGPFFRHQTYFPVHILAYCGLDNNDPQPKSESKGEEREHFILSLPIFRWEDHNNYFLRFP